MSRRLLIVVAVTAMLLPTGRAPAVAAAAAPAVAVQEGVTQPVFSYQDAIREHVMVESTVDSDGDGQLDRIAADVIRPAETEQGLRVPVLLEASPYYERIGRGNESETKRYAAGGTLVRFPLYYDNYFVPRGYAVVLADMDGTNRSDGCPTTGGIAEVLGAKAVVDWLAGRARAFAPDGTQVVADWFSGRAGMIGKSYDGTLANAVAATGVPELATIVPIAAISSWYDYYRGGGVTYFRNGPPGLARFVVTRSRRDACRPVRVRLDDGADDASGDYNSFWDERNYRNGLDNVRASVFVVHGLNDMNVKPNHFSRWWEGLARRGVPRKIWLARTGHVDPFDFRREAWVATLHRWLDHWLHGIDNGIMREPMADVERAADQWETYASWPDPAATPVRLRLGPAADGLPGTLTSGPVRGNPRQSFVDDPFQDEEDMVADPDQAKESRLLYLTPELDRPLRLSGTMEVWLRASADQVDTNLTVLLVDYGNGVRVDHEGRGEGIRTLDTESCHGPATAADDACYRVTEKVTHAAPLEIVTRGWLDAANRRSLESGEPLRPGRRYWFRWQALPEDYVFETGHRIGVVIAASDDDFTTPDPNRARVTVTLGQSHVIIPLVD